MKKNINILQNEGITNPDFERIYTAKLHWISYVSDVMLILISIIGIILFADIYSLLFLILLLKAIWNVLTLNSTQIYVTEKTLSISRGILSKNIFDISLRKYEGIALNQSLIGRILNFGKLMVSTGQISHSYKIEDPNKLRRTLISQSNNY